MKKCCFFFQFVFYFDFVFVQYDVRQVWRDFVKTWTLFYMVCFGDDRRFWIRDFLHCMGLIRVAWEKSNEYLSSNMGRKGRFNSHLF